MLKLLVATVLLITQNGLALFQSITNTQVSSINQPSVVGELRLHQFTSKIFGNTRTVRVLLPPGYDENNKSTRYPVLYLNDGQNLFQVATSNFNPIEWQVDETVDRLIRQKKIAPLIIVGIDNSGKRLRPKEYLPYEDKFLRPPEPSPEGKKYPEFLINEVMPFINERYQTRTDRDGIGIGGSSYGAVAALYTVLAKPGVFGNLLLESPSLYISDGQLLRDSQQTKRWPAKVYVGIGTNEGGRNDCKPGDWNREAVQDVLKLKKILQSNS
jgi:predicted alpha/beta superfamily hydrolase